MEKKKLGFKNLELEDQQRLETMKTENEKKHSKFIADYKELINLLDEEKNPLNLKDILEQIIDKFLSYKNDLMAYYAGLKSILDDTIKRRIFINNRKKNPKNNLKENLDIENIGHKKRLTQVNLSEYNNNDLGNSHNSLTNIITKQVINYLPKNIDFSKMIEEKEKLEMEVEKQNKELKNAQIKIAELEKIKKLYGEQSNKLIIIENENSILENIKNELQNEISKLQAQLKSFKKEND